MAPLTGPLPSFDCAEFDRSVDAWLDGEFDGREQAEADAHLASCEGCRRLAASRGELRQALRASLREALGPAASAGRAPETLRRRVTAAMARERRPAWRRILSPVPLATAAACAAGALVVLASHGGGGGLVEEAVRAHHRDLPLDVTAASIGADSIPGWFAGKLDFRPSPPRFDEKGARVVGARLSQLRELPAAYIRYALPHGQAGLFIVDDPDGRIDPGGREIQVGPRTVRLVSSRGYNVAVWRKDEIVYSLVSDLDEEDLTRLVRAAEFGR